MIVDGGFRQSSAGRSDAGALTVAEFAARYGLSERAVARFFKRPDDEIRRAVTDGGAIRAVAGWHQVLQKGPPEMALAIQEVEIAEIVTASRSSCSESITVSLRLSITSISCRN
jgi:hypothetical protein